MTTFSNSSYADLASELSTVEAWLTSFGLNVAPTRLGYYRRRLDALITTKIKRLAALREKLAHLEKTVETELRQELAVLHKQYGFSDLKSFFRAVRAAAGGGIDGASRKPGRPKKTVAAPKTRKRAKITAAIRARVKKLVQAGKSGSKIAKAVGISLPSVQNIKKAAGLVKSRTLKVRKVAAKKRMVLKAPQKNASAVPQPPAPVVTAGG